MEAYRTLKARHEPGETSWLTKDSGIGPTGASYVPMSEGRAHWHSLWVGKRDQADARSVT